MSRNQHDDNGRWWQNPALVAALASLVTAVAGVIAAAHGSGPA